MPLSFFAYIDESTDEEFPASKVMEVPFESVNQGVKQHVDTDNGSYELVGLGGVIYEDEADLKRQVCILVKRLDDEQQD